MATISFWGGAGTVTGSKYLIHSESSRVLVDCGMFQGLKELRQLNWEPPPFDPSKLNSVLITHAHIDHTGYLPRLVKQGFNGPIYCSRGTADLLKIMLPDAARLQEEEASYLNRHKLTRHDPALPLYDEKDARRTLDLLKPIANTGEPVKAAKGITAAFHISGHILGSSMVHLDLETAGHDGTGRRILFSGDLGRYDQPIINDPVPPPACDYLVVESTYGDRLHEAEPPKETLARIINEAAKRDSVVLIPAFAVGRTQEIVYLIRELEDEKKIPIIPVCVDSPMAAAATVAYTNRREEHDADYLSVQAKQRHPLRTKAMAACSSRAESKRLSKARGARVIISASGMMTGGRVLHHAVRVLPDPDATLVFVGFQAAGTRGRRVLDGESEIKIFREWIPVRCRVERIGGFSAHADWKDILRWLEGMPSAPRRTFITHGEPAAAEALADRIARNLGWEVDVPSYGQESELL
ncbi:MAG TPA: MBL fold metallo-hydrolase [Pyrinomonadaceae bacterium]|nr:MBL fold metallo-hydrolase [Pyrinomonadaceae bacterium]